jgi:hypothetical protein
VQNRANPLRIEPAGFERSAKLMLVHVVAELRSRKVQKLRPTEIRRRRKVVDQKNVALARAVELMNKVAADKTRAPSDDNHF